MKFRVLVGILTIAIVTLFGLVVKFSIDLKKSEQKLEISNTDLSNTLDSLKREKEISDSLSQVTKEHLAILAKATDSIYFSVAKKAGTFRSYRTYINSIGKEGAYYDAALVNLGSFFSKKGYVQFVESSGNNLYEKFMETDNFPDEPLSIAGEPSVSRNNLYRSKGAWRVRKGVIGNPDYPNTGANGDLINIGQIVKVLEVIESGDSKWVHIAYSDN